MNWKTRAVVLFWTSVIVYIPLALYSIVTGEQSIVEALISYTMIVFVMVFFGIFALPASIALHWGLREFIMPDLQNKPYNDRIAFGVSFAICFAIVFLIIGGFSI